MVVNGESKKINGRTTYHEHPVAALREKFQDWKWSCDQNCDSVSAEVDAPFFAFDLWTGSSEEAERTRRWSSSRPMRPRVKLWSQIRIEIGSELGFKAVAHPENTPPASTRKTLINIWNQNSAEPGSGTPSFLGMVEKTTALMASLTKGTPSTVREYDKRRGTRRVRIQGRWWTG